MNDEKTLKLANDYIFKRVFSKKGNEDLLMDLLESILKIKIEKIEVIPEAEIQKIQREDKLGRIDLKATVNEATTVDIEIQIRDYHNIIERSIFYASGLYHTGLKSGGDYKENSKVIVISILFFDVYKWKKFHSIGKFKEIELNEEMSDEIELHIIELPKFLKTKEGESKKLRQWLDFIANKRKGEIEMAVKENKMIAKAKQEYEYLTGDAAVRRIAFLRDKWERDHNSDIAWNRKQAKEEGRALGRTEGEALGRLKGRAEGRAEGRVEGRAEGRVEGEVQGRIKSKKEIAKNLLKEKVPLEIIIKATGLKEEEIKELMKDEANND